ncbi:MAG: Zn-dependent hydrolase [Rhodothermales bacterium]|nr:Zn-dependent hydrolase [Rhodothermales bacterium]
MTSPAHIPIDRSRFLSSLDALAAIGAIPGGGVTRLAFSSEDRAGRDWVEARMRALGMTVSIDAVGNLLGVRPGAGEGPMVLMGSHTDTVGSGGRFDGSLGVLAGLEAVAAMNDAGVVTEQPVGVASFVNEEGVRFMPDLMGSLYVTHKLEADAIRAIVGVDGTSIGENMDFTAYTGSREWRDLPIGAYLELHIEQGPVLEREAKTIGVVEGVQGLSWIEVVFEGASNHAGTTPMALRRDAGYAAGALVRFVRELAVGIGEPQRTTVGSIRLSPNIINVIAREAVVTVDLRHPDDGGLAAAEDRVESFVRDLAVREGLGVHTRKLARVAPVAFNPTLIGHVQASADRRGYTSRRMISGASHDAQIMAAHCPAAMIFVPSRGGVSHDVMEYTAPEHLVAGAEVLLDAALMAAGVGGAIGGTNPGRQRGNT